MTTAVRRASRIWSLAIVILAVPFLVGQGCPTDTLTGGTLTVNAGSDLTITSGSIQIPAAVAGGSGVYSYSWTPSTGLSSATVLNPTYTPTTAGTVAFTITVTDSLGATASDTVNVTYQPPVDNGNNPDPTPTGNQVAANAGADKTTSVGAPVTLEGSATGGTEPYHYAWSPSTGLSSASVAQPTFTPSVHGSVNYTLTVTDALGVTSSDSVTINIQPSATVSALVWGTDYEAGGYEVKVVFTRLLNKASAETLTNYRVNSTINPTSAVLDSDGQTVTLRFNTRLTAFAKLDISPTGLLKDSLGGRVPPMLRQAIGASAADAHNPTVTSRIWGNGQAAYSVLVTFSEAMDAASVEDVHLYSLAGVQPTQALLDSTGRVATITFADTVAGLSSTAQLTIGAGVLDINGQANASTAATAVDPNPADTTGPSAPASSRHWGIDALSYTVQVTFDEVMDKASAETLGNYSLNGDLPTGAVLDPTGRTVTLTFAMTVSGLSLADQLTILAAVKDINGQATQSTAATTLTANPADLSGPSLSADQGRVWGASLTAYTVLLTFSEVMDRVSAVDVTNYTLAANGGAATVHPTTAVLDATGRVVTLGFPTTTTGGFNRSDLLTVSANVKDVNGKSTTSVQPATISANPLDTIGPLAVSRVWAPGNTSITGASWSDADRLIVSPGAFTDYSFASGDKLTVTAGAAKGDYPIATKVDDDTLRLVDDINGATGDVSGAVDGTIAHPYRVLVTFNEVMDRVSATRVNNYVLHGAAGANLQQPSAAALDATGMVVTLSFSATSYGTGDVAGGVEGGFSIADLLEITSGVLDMNGRATTSITTGSEAAITAGTGDSTAPTVLRSTYIDANPTYYIDVTFSEVLDKATAEAAAYTVSGPVVVDGVILQGDGRTVRLTLHAASAAGATVTIPGTIKDIKGNAYAGGTSTAGAVLEVDAGFDQGILLGATATLAATVTGGSGTNAYSWTPIIAGLSSATVAGPTFTPTAIGDYLFIITVTDSEGRTASDRVIVSVSP